MSLWTALYCFQRQSYTQAKPRANHFFLVQNPQLPGSESVNTIIGEMTEMSWRTKTAQDKYDTQRDNVLGFSLQFLQHR